MGIGYACAVIPQEGLRTDRLLLRSWRDSDLATFAAMNADPRVSEFLPALPSRAQSDALAQGIRRHLERHGFGMWAVEARGRADFIGYTGLANPGWGGPRPGCVEIGWRLAAEHWGQGYATEAAWVALRFGFEVLRLDEILAWTVPSNRRSRRVMEKIGMRHDAAGDFDHPALPEGDRLRRHVLYFLRREAFHR